MNTSHHSELCCLQDAASSGHHASEQSPRLSTRRPRSADGQQGKADMEAPTATVPTEVKKHQHKHNLKHRYEVMETLGKGTYGKVKKAVERASLKTVRVGKQNAQYDFKLFRAVCLNGGFLHTLKYLAEGNGDTDEGAQDCRS